MMDLIDVDELLDLAPFQRPAGPVDIIEEVGGIRYRLHLCVRGWDLHEAWQEHRDIVHSMGPGKPKDRAIKKLEDACQDYWDHRKGVKNQVEPCSICKREMI